MASLTFVEATREEEIFTPIPEGKGGKSVQSCLNMDGLYTTNRMIPDAPNPMIPEPRPGPSNTGIWRRV